MDGHCPLLNLCISSDNGTRLYMDTAFCVYLDSAVNLAWRESLQFGEVYLDCEQFWIKDPNDLKEFVPLHLAKARFWLNQHRLHNGKGFDLFFEEARI